MTFLHRLARIVKRSPRIGVAGTLLLASSCALPSNGRAVARDESPSAINAHYSVPEESTSKTTSGQSPEAGTEDGKIQQISHEVVAPSTDKVKEWPALPSGQVHPFAPPVSPAQYSVADCPAPACYPTEPRITLPTESLSLQNCPMPWQETCEVPVPVCEPEVWADEYICDGGDRGLPVHYHGPEMAGLETEDTVAEYTDHTGESHVKPSTRACVYAPQFASVRSISTSEQGLAVNRAAGAHDGLPTAGLGGRRSAQVGLQNDQPIGIGVRSRVSGLDTDTATDSLAQIAKLVNHVKLINLFEDHTFFQRVELNQTEELYLAYGLQSTFQWTRDLHPVITASDVAGQEVIAKFQVEDYTGIEDKRTPGDLKIIKLADKHTAQPGDVVTFTIHYDNVGGRELHSVRIIDNLTPRLEFIPDSNASDRDGQLSVVDNNEGSLILTFDLAEPLPGESGGTLSFQARVR